MLDSLPVLGEGQGKSQVYVVYTVLITLEIKYAEIVIGRPGSLRSAESRSGTVEIPRRKLPLLPRNSIVSF